MKHYLAVLVVFLVNFLGASDQDHLKKRLYINTSNIFFEENKIFILHNNEIYQVSSIQSDKNGLYVNDFWPMPFICSRCGRPNPGFNLVCEKCGLPRDD